MMRKFWVALLALLIASPTLAQQVTQGVPTTVPISSLSNVGTSVCGTLKSANFNTTADQAIPITLPDGVTNFSFNAIHILNPSVSMTTAQGGFYTAASKGGTALVAAATAYTGLTTNAANTVGNRVTAPLAVFAASNVPTLYFSLTTAQGVTATADIFILCFPYK